MWSIFFLHELCMKILNWCVKIVAYRILLLVQLNRHEIFNINLYSNTWMIPICLLWLIHHNCIFINYADLKMTDETQLPFIALQFVKVDWRISCFWLMYIICQATFYNCEADELRLWNYHNCNDAFWSGKRWNFL